jgi:hypothetical protein
MSRGFSIDDRLSDLMGHLQAAQQYRMEHTETIAKEVTRSTALAVLIDRSPRIRGSLQSFGFRCEDYRESIGLQFPIKYSQTDDIDIYESFQKAIVRYSESDFPVLITSDDMFAVAILEDALYNNKDSYGQYELEGRVRAYVGNIRRLQDALQSRTLSFDPRRKYSSAPFYSDHPARRDVLNRKAVAESVATMIETIWKEDAKEDNIDRTFMVHLHGRWGSGKTSILNFLKDTLLSRSEVSPSNLGSVTQKPFDPSWIIVDYNAWRNQTLGPAWWTVMDAVYRQARDQLGGWLRKKSIFLILRDRWWRIRCSYAPYALVAVLSFVLGFSLIWLWQAYLFGEGKPWVSDGLKIIG